MQLLGSLEGKLDMLIGAVQEVRNDQKEVASKAVQLATQMTFIDSHERRIQDLEKYRSYVLGAIAAAGVLGGAVAWVINLLAHSR